MPRITIEIPQSTANQLTLQARSLLLRRSDFVRALLIAAAAEALAESLASTRPAGEQ